MMSVRVSPYYFSYQKRVFDICLALLLLLLTSPVMIVIITLSSLTIGSPIFFIQPRLGWHKKPFSIYKFRTMYANAEKDRHKYLTLNEAPTPMFKASHDPRFVGIGRWLSISGLDELPQLWNIVRGEMSFVGPRPLPVKEALKLTATWDFRYQVRPGIFSAWSLSNKKYASLERWRQLDKETVIDASLLSDIQLISQNIRRHVHRLTT